MRVALYCKCGSGAEGDIDPKGADTFKFAWYMEHCGEGHSDCSMEEAVAAYREQNNGEMPMGHEGGQVMQYS